MEISGKVDRYEKLQPLERPEVDASFVGVEIEQLWIHTEEDGTEVHQWCQGKVVAVKNGNKVHIEWHKKHLREGDPSITEEKLMKSKWNKHVEESWRMNPDYLS